MLFDKKGFTKVVRGLNGVRGAYVPTVFTDRGEQKRFEGLWGL